MSENRDELAIVCQSLIEQNARMAQQISALTNVNAILLRELCQTHGEPLEHLSKLEAELGGLGEAIAIGISKRVTVPVYPEAITEVFERVLRQARASLEALDTAKTTTWPPSPS